MKKKVLFYGFSHSDSMRARLLCALAGVVCAVFAFSLFMPNPEHLTAKVKPNHEIVLDTDANCGEGECGELRC